MRKRTVVRLPPKLPNCRVPRCGKVSRALGLCEAHYQQARRSGKDPAADKGAR